MIPTVLNLYWSLNKCAMNYQKWRIGLAIIKDRRKGKTVFWIISSTWDLKQKIIKKIYWKDNSSFLWEFIMKCPCRPITEPNNDKSENILTLLALHISQVPSLSRDNLESTAVIFVNLSKINKLTFWSTRNYKPWSQNKGIKVK